MEFIKTVEICHEALCMIILFGRETEWLFSCDEGRKELQRNAGFERLLVVLLNHEIDYHCLDDVKAELSSKVLELAPPDVQKQVYISISCLKATVLTLWHHNRRRA